MKQSPKPTEQEIGYSYAHIFSTIEKKSDFTVRLSNMMHKLYGLLQLQIK